MDEKYIQDLYNQLGGQSKFGNFNDFKNLIKTDKAYQKDFYNSFGAKKLGDFNDFSGLVSAPNQKKKDLLSLLLKKNSRYQVHNRRSDLFLRLQVNSQINRLRLV